MPDHSQMIILYLQENKLSNDQILEVLKQSQRIVEHQEVQEQLNKPNKQIKIEFEG